MSGDLRSAEKPYAAEEGLCFYNQLYAIDQKLKDVTPEERKKERLECSHPVLNAFSIWLRTQSPGLIPHSALGQAIKYCGYQWVRLTMYLQDGKIEIDNNRSECK